MRIGVDFGTTHTAAARYDGRVISFVPLDPQNSTPQMLRSLLYIDRAHQHRLGVDAARTFLAQDTGRDVILEDKLVGTIENTVASQEGSEPIHIVYDVTIQDDVGVRGRLLQSIKTGLRSRNYTGTNIFGRFYTLEELIGLILTHVRQQAEITLGQEVRTATLGRPVHFSNNSTDDSYAEDRLRQAAGMAGFQAVDFMPEPVAAARFYLQEARPRERIFVFDFGGGTLDFTLIASQRGKKPYDILASHGVAVGGDDLDSALMRGHVAPFFGTESIVDVNYDGEAIPFPVDMARLLEQWQTIPVLSRPQHKKVIDRAIRYSEEPEQFRRLHALVTQNYGFALFERIEQAKRALSSADVARISLDAGALRLSTSLHRRQFNRLIQDELATARLGVRRTLSLAGVSPDSVDVAVMTGGSSAIPLFQQMVAAELPAARLVQSDAFGSVTAGLALDAYERS
ncbi:MAG: Hsp70 family protein [Caldilineaceae bacterium]